MTLTAPLRFALIVAMLPLSAAWAQNDDASPINPPDMHACKSRWQALAH